MGLIVSPEFLTQTGFSEQEIREELAILFYKRGRISLGKAAEFAAMHKLAFQQLLSDRRIPLNYDLDDLKQDLDTLKTLDQ